MVCSRSMLVQLLLLLTVFFGSAGCMSNGKQVVGGVLHGELVWQGEVLVEGDVVLEEDVRLTIMPGTRVRFLPPDPEHVGWVEHPHFPGSELIIKGRIHAVGTPAEPIFFEALEFEAPVGSWGAINLVGSQEAVFEYCVFRQAESAIHSWDSAAYIEQSIFEDNQVALRFNNSEILIEHNLLRNNHTAVRFHFGAPVICENDFQGNRVNLFITSHPRDYHIENNSFGTPEDYHVVFGEEVPEDVNLAGNFWANQEKDDFDKAFYDGRRSSYLGMVLTEPQLLIPSSLAGASWSL